jgi:hypothetical protein
MALFRARSCLQKDEPRGIGVAECGRAQTCARTGRSLTGLKEWTTEFFLPSDSGPFRVRVREVELIPNMEPRPGAFLRSATPGEVTERTVFTDTVLLPAL